jgi:hypothetical protein
VVVMACRTCWLVRAWVGGLLQTCMLGCRGRWLGCMQAARLLAGSNTMYATVLSICPCCFCLREWLHSF